MSEPSPGSEDDDSTLKLIARESPRVYSPAEYSRKFWILRLNFYPPDVMNRFKSPSQTGSKPGSASRVGLMLWGFAKFLKELVF